MVISQGSSGSDRAFRQALVATLAAFPPDTFAAMRAEGRLWDNLHDRPELSPNTPGD